MVDRSPWVSPGVIGRVILDRGVVLGDQVQVVGLETEKQEICEKANERQSGMAAGAGAASIEARVHARTSKDEAEAWSREKETVQAKRGNGRESVTAQAADTDQ